MPPSVGPESGKADSKTAGTKYSYRSSEALKSTPLELMATLATPAACAGDSHCSRVDERKRAGTSEVPKRHQLDELKYKPSTRTVVPPRVGPISGCKLTTAIACTKLNVTASRVAIPPACKPTETGPAAVVDGDVQVTLVDERKLTSVASAEPNVHHVSKCAKDSNPAPAIVTAVPPLVGPLLGAMPASRTISYSNT